MEGLTLDVVFITDIVKKMLNYFIDTWTFNCSSRNLRYNHVDVTLLKESKCYAVQVTNCGPCTCKVLEFSNNVFYDAISIGRVSKNSRLALVHLKRKDVESETVYDLHFEGKCLSLTEITSAETRMFPSWKEYISFRLAHKLLLSDSRGFKEFIFNEITRLQANNPNVKLTYHVDKKVIYNSHIRLDDEYKSCEVLSTALTNVIKQSVNREFLEGCYKLLKTENAHQVESTLLTKLLPMIHANYVFPEAVAQTDGSNNGTDHFNTRDQDPPCEHTQ